MVDLQTKIPTFALDSGFARQDRMSQGVVEFAGADRLSGGAVLARLQGDAISGPQGRNGGTNFGITGVNAHAAVRMHAYPVSGSFWAFCPKTKTPHFQRWKVAH